MRGSAASSEGVRYHWRMAVYRLPRLLLFFALLACALSAPPVRADAEDDLEDLLDEWEIVVRRKDERGWEEQRRVLDKIADVGTKQSKHALKRLRDQSGRGDWRRTRLVLAAMARHASPREVDGLIRWVEVGKDVFLLESLGEVLAQVRAPATIRHLCGKGLKKATPVVKAQIARALGMRGDKEAVPALLLLLKERFVRVRVEALDALAKLEDERAVSHVLVFLKDKDDRVRDAAARTLGQLGDKRVGEALVKALRDECPRVVESAALSLGMLRDPERIPDLIERLHETADINERVAHACAVALEEITGKAIGLDPDRWSDYWEAVKDRPFVRVDPEHEPPEGRTVPANRYYGFPICSSRVVFVLDVSRSMGWNKRLETAQAELTKVIEHLSCSAKFNIVIFSDGANAWEQELELADARAIRKATKFVRKQRPQNGTNTWAALQLALKDEEADTIFLLSDGQPSVGAIVEPDLILAEMRTVNRYRRVRIHCVALLTGAAPTGFAGMEDMEKAEAFMRRLAADHDGNFKAVK